MMRVIVDDISSLYLECPDCKTPFPLFNAKIINAWPMGDFYTCKTCQQPWRWDLKPVQMGEIEVTITREELPVFPVFYRPGPHQGKELPLFWRDEQGNLPAAITAFVNYSAGHIKKLYPAQIELTRRYVEYFLKAPCWKSMTSDMNMEEDLNAAIKAIRNAKTAKNIQDVIEAMLKLGIDPF